VPHHAKGKADAVALRMRAEPTTHPEEFGFAAARCKKVTNTARSKWYTYADFNAWL
jgi:hypothetical protein